MKSKSLSLFRPTLSLVACAVAVAAAVPAAHAAENRSQRYTAGLGGSDMTTMLVPGWYGQVSMIHYHATKLKNQRGDDYTINGSVPASQLADGAAQAVATNVNPALATATRGAVLTALNGQGLDYSASLTNFRADAYVMLPRITYISEHKLWGAHLGFTAMLPLVARQTSLAGQTAFTSNPTPAIATGVTGVLTSQSVPGAATIGSNIANGVVGTAQSTVSSSVNSTLAARNDQTFGIGDLEFAPVLNWEIGDHQTVTVTPTLVVPTGEYDKTQATNPGFGDYFTFRPSIQYGFIGDGWDVGARAVFSFNSKNTETKYRSGNMFNLDFALMKFVSDNVRLGMMGYVVQQLQDDSSEVAIDQAAIDAADGNRMRAYALGPALGWLYNGGEMLIEGKILHEFGARNRAEGTTYMLMVSKPFGL